MFKFIKKNKSVEGKIIDLPIDKFKKQVEKRHLTLGMVKTLDVYLTSAYNQLVQSKDSLVSQYVKAKDSGSHSEKELDTIHKTIEGIYAEMTKIEQKVLYLKERSKTLMDADKD